MIRKQTGRAVYLLTMSALLWVILSGMIGPGHNEPADATPTQAVTTSTINGDALVAHEVTVISAQRGCAPVVVWLHQHHGQYPVSMILKQEGTYRVTVTTWTYPAPRNQWTLALCVK